MTNNNQRVGTKNYKFKPHHDSNNKSGKKFYYQHICVGNNGFQTKSSEELRFEDQFQQQAAPGTDAQVNNDSNSWASKSNNNLWNNNNSNSNTNNASNTNNNNNNTWSWGNNNATNSNANNSNTGNNSWGSSNNNNAASNTNNNNNSSWNFGNSNNQNNNNNSSSAWGSSSNNNSNSNTNANNNKNNTWSWGQNNSNSSFNNTNASNTNTNNNNNNTSFSWGNNANNNTNNAANNANKNSSSWSWGNSNNNNNNNSMNKQNNAANNTKTNTQNNNNTNNTNAGSFSWGSANNNSNSNNSNNNNNASFSWGATNNNNNNNTAANNNNNTSFSWGSSSNNNNNNSSNNNGGNASFSWGNNNSSSNNNNNSSTANNNNSAWNFNSNNNTAANNNNNKGGNAWNVNANNNNNNNNNASSNNNTFSWGNSNNNNSSNNNNNNNNKQGGGGWNFGDIGSKNNNNNNNNNSSNNNSSSWNFGPNNNNNNASNNNNNNFGSGNSNTANGPLFAKHNQNPYQIDMRSELKELNDPNSELNQSFAGQREGYWKQSIFSPKTKKNINGLANSYIQSSKKRMNSSIIKLTPRNALDHNPTRRTPVITIQPRSAMMAKSTLNMSSNPNQTVNNPMVSRLNQTTMILSKIVPGKHGEPDSKLSTFIDYQAPTPVRPYTSSELRRIIDLGPVPEMPDLSAFDVHKNEGNDKKDVADAPLSDNSGDSPRENVSNMEDKEEEEEEEEDASQDDEQLAPVILLSTHRKDGVVCPKLSRDGYFTEPPMEQLKKWNAKQLYQCRDFAVYHEKYGSVEWPGVSDIRSLDLDKIVFLNHGRIEVYPDDIIDKPQRGVLLNKFAKITLNEIWPEGVDGTQDDEEADCKKKNYGALLMAHCQDNDCKFIQYNTTKGNWLFSVEHFTIYGLPTSSKSSAQSKPAQAQKAAAAAAAVHPPIESKIGPLSTPIRQLQPDDVHSQVSHPSALFYHPYNNRVGLNELKNQDIANSFSDLIHKPFHDEAQTMVIDQDDAAIDEQSQYEHDDDEEAIDDLHDEVPPDTIIFHENVMPLNQEAVAQKQERNSSNMMVEYYPNSTILKEANPAQCHENICTAFETAFQNELDAVLEQSAKNKYNKHQRFADNDDIVMSGFGLNRNAELPQFREEEFHRKTNWEAYDLAFRNRNMFSAFLSHNKLYTVMKKAYFQNDKVAFFNELKESNAIETHSVITGFDKILTKPIYFELVHKLLTVHKRYYFDDEHQWRHMSNGDKLQDLGDSYAGEIKIMLAYMQNMLQQNKKMELAKSILIKFYDALQLILALYAPRCGAGEQSNHKIKAKTQDINHLIHEIAAQDDDDDDDDDEDKKMSEQNPMKNESYNELFARRINISHWLQKVIADQVDAELAAFDAEIARVESGKFDVNENEDEKYDIEMNENEKKIMNDIDAKEEINRLNDEKIFVMLTANRKTEAVELALKCGDYKLASLISQSSHFAATKNNYQPFVDIRHQIDYWRKHKIWETFNDSQRKIYALLAGRYVEIVFNAKFNWFRSFAIILWYYLPLHWTLSECINFYDGMCKHETHPFCAPNAHQIMKKNIKEIDRQEKEENDEIVAKYPLYTIAAKTFTKNELKEKFPNDICFDLLQKKCEMTDVLNIFSSRNIAPFNLEYLFVWIIYDLLSETEHISITPNERNMCSNIYHSFVEQLERMGFWQWAIYLSLFAAKGKNLYAKYNYDEIAYLILRRNINRKIPQGFDAPFVYQKKAQPLNKLTLAQLNNDENHRAGAAAAAINKYKYCDESDAFAAEYLSKFWQNVLDNSTINGLKFLVHIGLDKKWIIHCLAEYAEANKNWITAFLSYSHCMKWNKVHQILMNYLFMDWLFEDKIDQQLQNTLETLENELAHDANWKTNGKILFEYIRVMKAIQNEEDLHQDKDLFIKRIRKIKEGIDDMLNNLNKQEEDDQDLKKRVCLITMKQRLETCLVHLTQT